MHPKLQPARDRVLADASDPAYPGLCILLANTVGIGNDGVDRAGRWLDADGGKRRKERLTALLIGFGTVHSRIRDPVIGLHVLTLIAATWYPDQPLRMDRDGTTWFVWITSLTALWAAFRPYLCLQLLTADTTSRRTSTAPSA